MKIEDAVKLRKKIKRKKPNFIRQEYHKRERLSLSWRKPNGSKSKLRLKQAHRKFVSPGYGSPKIVRHMHGAGVFAVTVATLSDIDKIKKGEGALIASSVGFKKKAAILQELTKRGITVVNIKDPKKYMEKFEEKKKHKKAEKEEKAKKVKKPAKKEEKESIEDKLSDEEKKKIEKKEIDRLLTKKF